MKKLLLALTIAVSASAFTQAQEGIKDKLAEATFGVRAFGLFNTSSLGEYDQISELGNHGFSIGLAAKMAFGDQFFITPELYYSHSISSELSLPILLGLTIVEDKLDIIAGPNLIYTFSKDSKQQLEDLGNEYANTGTIDYKGLASSFEFGYMAGLQYHINNFMISARYQGGLSGKVVDFANENSGMEFQDSSEERIKTSYISIGIGFNFGGDN